MSSFSNKSKNSSDHQYYCQNIFTFLSQHQIQYVIEKDQLSAESELKRKRRFKSQFIKEIILLDRILVRQHMEAIQNIKLVHHTALAFTVEQNNQQIQALREKFDPAFVRWQPHINFCFPFVDTPIFEQTYQILQQRFNNFPPFEIVFREVDSFPHGTIFLNPLTNGNQLQDIYHIITHAIPQLKANKQFHPHMTVGKFGKGELAARKAQFNKDWKQWVVRCDGICMIQRGKDTPFKTYKKIQFRG